MDTPAFKSWFGASRVTDMSDRPRPVYHGTPNDFAVFDKDKLGGSGHHATSGLGFFFAQDPVLPGEFAQGAGGNVMPVYLKI